MAASLKNLRTTAMQAPLRVRLFIHPSVYLSRCFWNRNTPLAASAAHAGCCLSQLVVKIVNLILAKPRTLLLSPSVICQFWRARSCVFTDHSFLVLVALL